MFFVNRSASSSSKDKPHSRRRPGSISRQSRDSPETLISSIINGNEYAQSFPQSSQYRAGGVSSCGLAALNCTRIVFETEENGQNSVLKTILTPDTTNKILTVSDMWSGSSHLEVDDLLQLPLFSRSLNLIETQYSEVSTKQLLHLLRQLEDRNGIAAAVITRPPEIILSLKIPVYQMGSAIPLNLFVIFDSHPRPSHPDGAGWLFTTSINDTSRHLYSILAVDRRILNDPSMQWEAQLLNHFSGHIIAPPDKRGQHGGAFYDPEVQEVIWNTSFRILGLQAELAEMKNRKEVLEGINKRYEDEQDAVRRDREEARRRIQELEETNDILLRQTQPVEPHPPRSDISAMSYAAALRRQRDRHGHDDDFSSSQFRVPDRSSSSWKGKQREMDPDPDSSKSSQRAGPINFFNWDNKQKPEMDPDPDSYKFSQRTGPLNFFNWDNKQKPEMDPDPDSYEFSQRTGPLNFFNWENKQKPDDKLAGQPNSSPKAHQCEPGRESNPISNPNPNPNFILDFPDLSERELQEQHDYMQALEQQRQFDDEALRVEQEREELSALAQTTFTCGICFEVLPDEDLASVNKCGHQFCRSCLQAYALSKINDRRFPIVCPTCMSDSGKHPDPGIVEQDIIEQMNIPQREYEILEDMMLSRYCIPIHCAQCTCTYFVDRQEYQEQDTVACPLPGCLYAWCKHCSQAIGAGGPPHSCDGSNELEHLMRENGWKACPGCKTNVLKTDGCNHMTCISPGCNMHFCYRCGEGIVQSALRQEIQDGITAHYQICRLFEDVADS